MTGFSAPPNWQSGSDDPNDRTFGDIVEPTRIDTASAFDAVLVGEPYDGGVLGRKGAADGPQALRHLLAGTKTHHFGEGPVEDVADVGDIQFPNDAGWGITETDTWTVQQRVAEATRQVHESSAFPVFMGGDNSLTVPNAAPLVETGSVGAISLDAHLDCRELIDGPTSGTPYRQLHERGLDAFCVLGARHFETSTSYAEYAREQGAEIVTADEVGRDLEGAIERALDAVSDVDAVYCSLDLDVLDGGLGPGVSAPTPGGLTAREVFECCRRLGSHSRLAGFEVVELAPRLDEERATARTGARAIAHLLAGREDRAHSTPLDRTAGGGRP